MVYPGIFGLKEIIVGGQGCLMLSGGHQITGIYNQKVLLYLRNQLRFKLAYLCQMMAGGLQVTLE